MKFFKFGKYILVKKLATGGMAEIFLSKTRSIGGVSQFVVVKRILPQFSSNSNFVAMFKNEGSISSHLKHAHMTHIYEFGVYDKSYYMAMEYVSGVSLKDLAVRLRKKNIKFPVAVVLYITRAIASALYYMHNSMNPETGLPLKAIHRDISPHNVMIGYNGDIKLIDFGIAKTEDSDLTTSGVVKGKFSYMSPEQTKGLKLDHRTDIFSLGCVLWELIAGKKLFGGSSPQEIIEQIRKCHVPKLSKIRSDVPSSVDNILQLCLTKNRSVRYQQCDKVEKQMNTALIEYAPQFSHLEFKTFISDLYKQSIAEEKETLIRISKKLKSLSEDQQVFKNRAEWLSLASSKNSKMQTINQLIPKKISSVQKKKKTKKEPIKSKCTAGDQRQTVISDQAPISHAITDVSSIQSFDISQQSKKDHASYSKGSYYANLKRSYRKKNVFSKFKQTSYNMIGLAIVSAVIYMILKTSNYYQSEDKIVDVVPDQKISNLAMRKKNQQSSSTTNRKVASLKDAQETFKVYITTSPSGSEIYVNGKKWNTRSPASVSVFSGRKNVIQVVQKGYQPYKAYLSPKRSIMNIRLKRL